VKNPDSRQCNACHLADLAAHRGNSWLKPCPYHGCQVRIRLTATGCKAHSRFLKAPRIDALSASEAVTEAERIRQALERWNAKPPVSREALELLKERGWW
jgi:hypothetical protein